MEARHQSQPPHLLHFSEDPGITRFVPHVPATNPDQPPMVWTIDEVHAPLFWFPRECPRITFWSEDGTPADRLRVLASLQVLRDEVIASGHRFSMCRMGNAQP